jgi:hypothetical protein
LVFFLGFIYIQNFWCPWKIDYSRHF